MAVSYLFQLPDKSALSYTAFIGLRDDMHLSGSEYPWASSIYYFHFLVASYRAVSLVPRFPVCKILGVLGWGAILMFTALYFKIGGLLANHIMLRIDGAAIASSLSICGLHLVPPLRHGAWFLCNTVINIFGGIVAYSIGYIKSIAPWKSRCLPHIQRHYCCGLACHFFLLPGTPTKVRFLTGADHIKAIERVKEKLTGINSDKLKRYQCVEAMTDIQAWLLFTIQTSVQIANGGVHGFRSIFIKGMGFSTLNILLLT
ncbi:major facilitator superfamily transporter [Colletotrichum incanum]|uniref:Major facilitator superfamily transporter n=1 Tax=Colletotrichum incanum TaxID=1573173 RepID=A0A166UJM7_COLIC|nr:major facilitator superfamily transporter [Colletotrichum incanum]